MGFRIRPKSRVFAALYLRNFVFGVEDSLVSTVGLLSGVAAAGLSSAGILATGMVLVFVEAFSMSLGSVLSENSTEEYMERQEMPLRQALGGGAVMFFSYFISGLIPILPYLLFGLKTAFWTSMFLGVFFLAVLGIVSAKISKVGVWREVAEMVVLGGLAALVGIGVGKIFGGGHFN